MQLGWSQHATTAAACGLASMRRNWTFERQDQRPAEMETVRERRAAIPRLWLAAHVWTYRTDLPILPRIGKRSILSRAYYGNIMWLLHDTT
jgi:hypothetical protein